MLSGHLSSVLVHGTLLAAFLLPLTDLKSLLLDTLSLLFTSINLFALSVHLLQYCCFSEGEGGKRKKFELDWAAAGFFHM